LSKRFEPEGLLPLAVCKPFLLVLVVVTLAACSTTPDGKTGQESETRTEVGSTPVSFRVDVVSEDRSVASYLEEHLELQRYTSFPDLQANELRRLLGEAESNARDLLAALGYFEPKLNLHADDAPSGNGPRRVVIEVDPGPQATVTSVQIEFAEPMNSDPAAAEQRETIRRDWLLDVDSKFSQTDWDSAKSRGLRTLQVYRYPAARIATSQATVHTATNHVDLQITYDAGPAYRFGAIKLPDIERYDAEGIRNIAHIPTGDYYSEEALLNAQQRLSSSGYFDSSFLILDTSSTPDNATVNAQLREARYQKLVFGPGYSTDTGPRLTIDHTHNKMWPLGWRTLNQLTLGTSTQSLTTHMTDMPNSAGWAWYTGMSLERADYGDFKTDSVSLTGGRSKSLDHSERRYYMQYDASNAEGSDAPTSSSSILANYAWTGRHFDSRTDPASGYGLGAETGIGLTLTPQRDPFARVVLRAMELWPFGGRNAAGRRSRIALRGEAGTVFASTGVDVPVRLLFLTGGDTTVRGYSYQSIGSPQDDGSVFGARYMAMASLEWQHPITLFGDAGSWEHTIFVDTGTATDSVRDALLYTGVGTGMRWRSPVGPLQLDVAYGTRVHKWRLHLRIGFQF
jgi:translocation and assembly module TamA